jgi:hypothetical protein
MNSQMPFVHLLSFGFPFKLLFRTFKGLNDGVETLSKVFVVCRFASIRSGHGIANVICRKQGDLNLFNVHGSSPYKGASGASGILGGGGILNRLMVFGGVSFDSEGGCPADHLKGDQGTVSLI